MQMPSIQTVLLTKQTLQAEKGLIFTAVYAFSLFLQIGPVEQIAVNWRHRDTVKGVEVTDIVTKTGDSGEAGLADGRRADKDAPEFEALGSVDELNAQIGLLRVFMAEDARITEHELYPGWKAIVERLKFFFFWYRFRLYKKHRRYSNND